LTDGNLASESASASSDVRAPQNGRSATNGWRGDGVAEYLSRPRFARSSNGSRPRGRVQVDGKFFAAGGRRFEFRGVTYGTFAAREDGALFPDRERIERDLGAMREAGFTVVRSYTAPPEDLLEAAARHDLRVLAGVFYPDWRYLLGGSRRQQRRVAREARAEVREVARRLAGNEQVIALSLGNEEIGRAHV